MPEKRSQISHQHPHPIPPELRTHGFACSVVREIIAPHGSPRRTSAFRKRLLSSWLLSLEVYRAGIAFAFLSGLACLGAGLMARTRGYSGLAFASRIATFGVCIWDLGVLYRL